jgi:cytochrome c-type biogenesis protein
VSARGVARYASRLAGALLALSGGYLLYYWLPQLLGAARPGDDGLAALSAQVSTWISAHQLAVALTAATLALATAAAIVHARRTPATRTTITAATDCCPPASDQTAPAQPGATCYSPHGSAID